VLFLLFLGFLLSTAFPTTLYKGDVEKISSFRNKTSTKMDQDNVQKSKMDAFIPKMRDCAYFTEKTRRNYLQQCSKHYDEYLYKCLMKEKSFWIKNDEMMVEMDIRDHENVTRKCSTQQEQEKEEKQPQEMKKKRKSTGRPRGRPRIHPKKQKMCIMMEDLHMKASDLFGVKRGKKVKFIDALAAE